jgi:HAE1 family hydrophobic/amphiphilic exporter-1
LGSLPLVTASGAGEASRHSIGVTVVGGMLAITVLGVLLVPAFYVSIERLAERLRPREPVTPPAAPPAPSPHRLT